MPRILATSPNLERYGSILGWLRERGVELVRCESEDLLEQAVRRAPDLVLFGIGEEPEADARTLHVLRRMLPEVPLIFVADGVTLVQRRSFQEFRPTFWALPPADEAELREAIVSALKGRLASSDPHPPPAEPRS